MWCFDVRVLGVSQSSTWQDALSAVVTVHQGHGGAARGGFEPRLVVGIG